MVLWCCSAECHRNERNGSKAWTKNSTLIRKQHAYDVKWWTLLRLKSRTVLTNLKFKLLSILSLESLSSASEDRAWSRKTTVGSGRDFLVY